MKKILSALRRADEHFALLDNADRIAVGLSGGKDSMVLLCALHYYKMYMKKSYELVSLTVDLGFNGFDTGAIEQYAHSLGIEHITLHTQIGEIVFDIRKEKNPCALCAKMRKGALYAAAKEMGCNKAAFAHHIDDVIETFLMSLLYEGRMHTFAAKTHLSRQDITLVRPLIYAREHDIACYAQKKSLPVCKNPCPASGYTKREEAKEILAGWCRLRPGAKESIENAVKTGLLDQNNTQT